MKFQEILEGIIASIPTTLIKTTHIGDAYDVVQGSIEYGFFCVTPNSLRRDPSGHCILNVLITAADRLMTDDDNSMDVLDDMQRAIRSTLNTFEEEYGVELSSYTIEFFHQQFSDYCAGGYTYVDISYTDDIGDCDIE